VDLIPPEALLADFPPPMQQIASRLRGIVRTTLPDAVERVRPGWRLIGYDLPVGRHGTFVGYIAPEPKHVHLGFAWGVLMDDPRGVLKGAGITKQVRWLTFEAGDRVDARLCQKLIKEAARVATMSRGERRLRAMQLDDGAD
jgi:hypothetical protein